MKRARIFHRGRDVWGELVEGDTQILLADGGTLPVHEVSFMPPIMQGATIFALGLNYADHNAELGFQKKVCSTFDFLKGQNTLLGNGGCTPRPADANQMHPECELVAIIGRPVKKIKPEAALDYVAGYTIANDYAIREYLENYYRPNLRVKNRDATTPVGPWVVDAADIGDPQALALSTTVNGKVVQSGSTADMVLNVAGLIAYLSDFMTLLPGDAILTGTPHGVHFVAAGDEVVCDIEKLGRLVNHVVAQ